MKSDLYNERCTIRMRASRAVVFFASVVMLTFLGGAVITHAYEITAADVDVAFNDFVLSPAKLEVALDPGDTVIEKVRVINRTSQTKVFTLGIEDFTGSKDPAVSVELLGMERGPYSLKDYLHPEVMQFTLKSGQQIFLPIRVTIPKDAEPGGLYGSVLISSAAPLRAGSGAAIESRLGLLIFVRVHGEVNEDGLLEDFRIAGNTTFFTDANDFTAFELTYKNNGSVHLNPYGVIKISNMAGVVIDEVDVLPYFAMPQSVRYRSIEWDRGILLGRYTATAMINRGYDDVIDEKSVSFWVIPWKMLFMAIGGIALLLLIVRFIGRFIKVEIKH